MKVTCSKSRFLFTFSATKPMFFENWIHTSVPCGFKMGCVYSVSVCFSISLFLPVGPQPHTPSTPQCSIPYSVDEDLTIQCSWDPGPDQDPGLPTSYSIHWAADLDTK